jgi:sugar O-acyltransferase (sialic acid O-acetyltransferase NeuD family)
MSARAVLLVGAGGHARACIDVIENEGRFKIGGLIGQREEIGSRILGYPVLGGDADLERLRSEYTHALIAVGQIKSPEPRIRLFELARRSGYEFPTIVSPRAHVSRHATVGIGTIVMHGAIVNAGATVGCNCILNSQSLVEHDSVIGDHCHVATAAAINSGVRIGTASFIGSHSTVRQLVRIGARCVIGMDQRVLADCPDDTHLPAPRRPS